MTITTRNIKLSEIKKIALKFPNIEFWYDKHQKLWVLMDRKRQAASDWIAAGHLYDMTPAQFREFLKVYSNEVAEYHSEPKINPVIPRIPRLPNPAKRFTKKQLDALRKGFDGIQSVDPANPTYTKLTFMLDSYSQAMLKQLAEADIKFLSGLARNRLQRSKNPVKRKAKPATAKQIAARKLFAERARAGTLGTRKKAKKKTVRKANPDNRVLKVGETIYSVEFNGNGWYVFRNDKYGTHVEHFAGPGDKGKSDAIEYLAAIKGRKRNPKRTALKKDHLWQIALFNKWNKVVNFYGGVNRNRIAYTQNRNKAILFRTKEQAKQTVSTIPSMYFSKLKFNVAIVPENMTLPTLRKELGIETGKQ